MLDFSKTDNWIISENSFDASALGKTEAVFCLGNGYIGLRSAAEEHYAGETRDLLVAGSFDRVSPDEVTELPNAADMTNIEITLNGERFDLTRGDLLDYSKELCIRNGLLTRKVKWLSPGGTTYALSFERFVSLKRLHTFAARISISAEKPCSVVIRSGIDGRMTNDGSQHFTEGSARFYDKKFMQYSPSTIQSGIRFVLDAVHAFELDGQEFIPGSDINIHRRRMFSDFCIDLDAGQDLTFVKYMNVYTSRDTDTEGMLHEELSSFALEQLRRDADFGFDALLSESSAAWVERVWSRAPIAIEGPSFDQFAVHFAQYHMQIMVPAHDNRMNIGAKGLTGEGYKGHTFWDTEIFLLPYYIYSMPEVARNLLLYRYKSLAGAHRKAELNGYKGAQFPWESAWLDDGEVTPEYMGTDILTGQPIKVWSGIIEIHITSDVAFGVWQYYQCTGDTKFMEDYGYEIIMDCAKFWNSRLEDGSDGMLHINDVVGPDEYKEHVDDNAFTNYLAKWNMITAIAYADQLKSESPERYTRLDNILDLSHEVPKWKERAGRIYLTVPREDGVLPQDSTYLALKDIDLSKYRNQAHVGGIYKDYNQDQITQIQVSKQADVMVLFYLLEDQFTEAVKKASWDYYEPRTLHDSSLSLSTHSVLASDIGETKLAYEMFRKACDIDLGNDDPHSSDAGIHAASFGGLWQCVVFGFGGLRMVGGNLRIDPHLPDAWKSLDYKIRWQGQTISVHVDRSQLIIENETGSATVELTARGKRFILVDRLTV